MDLVDHYGQDNHDSDGASTASAVQTRLDRLLAAQEPLLSTVDSLRDLVRWRDEVVRLERTCDDAIGTLGGLADLLADGEETTRSAVHAGCAAWESLLTAAITRTQDKGELSPDADPAKLATGLMAALQGGLLLARTTRDIRRLEVALEMALGYVCAHALTR